MLDLGAQHGVGPGDIGDRLELVEHDQQPGAGAARHLPGHVEEHLEGSSGRVVVRSDQAATEVEAHLATGGAQHGVSAGGEDAQGSVARRRSPEAPVSAGQAPGDVVESEDSLEVDGYHHELPVALGVGGEATDETGLAVAPGGVQQAEPAVRRPISKRGQLHLPAGEVVRWQRALEHEGGRLHIDHRYSVPERHAAPYRSSTATRTSIGSRCVSDRPTRRSCYSSIVESRR